MGRHSRKAPAPARPQPAPVAPEPDPEPEPYAQAYAPPAYEHQPYGHQPYERQAYEPLPYQRQAYEPQAYDTDLYAPDPYEPAPYAQPPGSHRSAEPTVGHQGYAPPVRPGGHPEQREAGGAWGAGPAQARAQAPAPAAVYGDWRGVPRTAADSPPPAPRDPLTSTGSHRRVPGPRTPEAPAAPEAARGTKFRTYTGMAAAAVTTVLAVVVAGQVATENDSADGGARAAGDDAPQRTQADRSPASRSDGRPTPASPPPAAPAAQPPTYEQQMAQQLPIDAKLTGPGTFDTVAGIAKAPGKGKRVRYRVDVEQGLGMDPQLFADAVQRTLNDPRSWAHGDAMTFERVPGGEADFVITLASPGTTGVWCAKSGLDTTVDNVSCDSASTERVMINAFRWGQGSQTFGADQMLAYRQMLINHEVGHRLGHGHVSCQTPGALAPIMQQQTKSLDIDNIRCRPNPWVFPGS
ncbi:DUF3152 domain-containing protein [Streptomyces sp. NBC_00091]|uniref:DUF3152 domain-containing protein n=1 Tax=Streptomyces sp. NBC_00091 TaxID=2975648 RepID=UPI0022532301|nr:DUF3152 domain-containing protein [Streptomyces sp. NBC_00091]MCX5376022.1 DUF3152 domain-containing protein [Streptomyces sp. NBC_00091]